MLIKTCPACEQAGLITPIKGSGLCRPHYLMERRIKEALERQEADEDLLDRVAASSQGEVAREMGLTRQAIKHRVDAATARRLRLRAAGMVDAARR